MYKRQQLSLANLEKFAEIGLDAARDSVEQATAHAAALALTLIHISEPTRPY